MSQHEDSEARLFARAALLGCSACAFAAAAAAGAAEPDTNNGAVPTITVIGTMPLPGHELDASRFAAPVQTATELEIDRSHAVDLTAYMDRMLAGVYVNDIQNNPLQPDINYRGYTASPLQGTPEGSPFTWMVYGRTAVRRRRQLRLDSSDSHFRGRSGPGSNPLFGLNILGGALPIETKDGRGKPGTMPIPLLANGVGSQMRATENSSPGKDAADTSSLATRKPYSCPHS